MTLSKLLLGAQFPRWSNRNKNTTHSIGWLEEKNKTVDIKALTQSDTQVPSYYELSIIIIANHYYFSRTWVFF